MRSRFWVLPLLLVGLGESARAQAPAVIRLEDPGRGPGPALFARALAGPHRVIGPGGTQIVLSRDSSYAETVIVLGRDAVVDGTVEGDVIVVAGNLYLHPRSVVQGHAVALGGGVYRSALGQVQATESFRDFTYDIRPVPDGYALWYRGLDDRPEALFRWTGLYGLQIPVYDRTNGLSMLFGPRIAPTSKLRLDPRIIHRSNLGTVDGSASAEYTVNSRTTVAGSIERAEFSNDRWIWADPMNSVATLLVGHDTRNYYRATRAQTVISTQIGEDSVGFRPYFGGRWEQSYSVKPDSTTSRGPWSFHGRFDRDDMLRPNPPVERGTIISAIAGAAMRWTDGSLAARALIDLEGGGFSPVIGAATSLFQATFDGSILFPTFGLQTLRIDGHFVTSAADRAPADRLPIAGVTRASVSSVPRQRWVYLGGSGTIPTLELLELGGDQLVYLDARYTIPITRIILPLVGSPYFAIREVLGGADVQRFPDLQQATGFRVGLSVLFLQFMIDPVRRNRTDWSIGFALAR